MCQSLSVLFIILLIVNSFAENLYNSSNYVPTITNHNFDQNRTQLKQILDEEMIRVPSTIRLSRDSTASSSTQSNEFISQQQQPLPQQQPQQKKIIEDGTTTANGNNVLELVKNLDVRLKNIRNYELGVTAIQEIFDAMDFTIIQQNNSDAIKRIANRMEKKLEKALHIMSHLDHFFTNNMTKFLKTTNPKNTSLYLNTLIHPCPFEDFSLEQNYNKQQIEIFNYLKNGHQYNSQSDNQINQQQQQQQHDNNNAGDAGDNDNNDDDDDDENNLNFIANSKIVEELRRFNLDGNHLKHIFYLSRWDYASDHNCQYYFNDINFRYLFANAIQHKHVFLLIDNGNAFNTEQLELSKTFVRNILQMLSNSDTITIVLISEIATAMSLTKSQLNNTNNFIYSTTIEEKHKIGNFINNLNHSITLTNHTKGFEYSFELLKKQNSFNLNKPIEFVYITRGLLTKLTDSMKVLNTIANGQSKLNSPIVINTCAIILDEKRIMYEKQFLRDISQQNYTKYLINVDQWYDTKRFNLTGRLYIVTKRHPERIIKTSSAVFEGLFMNEMNINKEIDYIDTKLTYHQPVLDYNTKDVIISITKPIKQLGVIGLNLHLNDLAEDIIYFKRTDHLYAFMIDLNGLTIFHPSFVRPIAYTNQFYHVDIGLLENSNEFIKSVRNLMLQNDHGNLTIIGKNHNENLNYNWRKVQNAYIVCIVTIMNGNVKQMAGHNQKINAILNYNKQNEFMTQLELFYHRLDLISPNTPVCRHFRQIATLDTGTVFLSASSFQSPFVYLKNNRENKESLRTHTSIMAYIKDTTNLLANPGLLPQIRNDVSALYHVMKFLKKRHLENGPFRKYIIRRYVTTTNGVIQVYPGCILGTELEPSRRLWYRKAMKYPGNIIATEPYLDAGGAGYIITIAHTIFEGKSNAMHNAEHDLPIAIVAIDVPYGFFYKLIIESSSFCLDNNMKCFLMNDHGYLLGHPSFMEPSTQNLNNRRPKEHLTHKESFVANDILNHKKFVNKQVCGNYQNRTINRYYTLNVSLNEIFTNVVHGDRTKYQITIIRGTNIFAAVLNSTCDGGAFCPCSTVDKICLNCNRMDQLDCECPCECPMKITNTINQNYSTTLTTTPTTSTTINNSTSTTYDYCEPEIENWLIVNSLSYDWNKKLKQCININCDLYQTQIDCFSVMGCEWCQLDIDNNQFSSGFCTTQISCFNGILGSQTPYGDNDLEPIVIEKMTSPAYSTAAPVGGAIIVSILIVGFAIYCYRQNLDNTSDQLYPESLQDDNNYGLPLSRFHFDDISPHDDNNLMGDGHNISHILHKNLIHPLANSIAVSDSSPYHMSSNGYRRPTNNNGESDNGYSTMTPHEDSENMCFNLVEPLINSNKRLSMSADSMSISTSISSPTNNQNHNQHLLNKIQPTYLPISSPTRSTISDHNLIGQTVQTGQTTTILPSQQQQHQQQQLSPHHILAPITFHRHMEA